VKILPSDVIALAALIVSGWTLFQTILFNRRQQKFEQTNERLNLLLIEKEQAETLEQKRADISANFYKAGKNDYRLKVFNRGKAEAKNVRLDILDESDLLLIDDVHRKFPVPLMEPHGSVEVIASVHMGSPSRTHIKVTWDDAGGTERCKELHPTL
jgi:hypothetical protein